MEIVLAQGSALLSKIIMKSTGYEYSHCGLRYSVPDEKWMVHASLFGVVPEWSDYFVGHYVKCLKFKTKFEVADLALDNAVAKYKHASYDYLGLIGAGLVMVLARFGIKIRNPLGSKRDFVCTEWIGAWLRECMILDPTLNLIDFEDIVAPKDIGDYLMSRPDLFDIMA